MRVNRDNRALRLHDAVAVLLAVRQVLEGSFGGFLHVHIDGRVNLEAILIDGIRTVFIDELLRDVIDEVRSFALILFLRVRLDEVEFFLLCLIGRGLVDVAVLGHLVEDRGLAFLRGLEVVERRIVIRALRDAGEHRALVEREVLDILAEVRAGSGLHAVSPLAKINLVEVELEDFRLRVLALKLESQEYFLNLALECAVLRQIRIFGELLRDGRAAF